MIGLETGSLSEDPRNHEPISSCRVALLRGRGYIYIRRNKAHRGGGKGEGRSGRLEREERRGDTEQESGSASWNKGNS